MTAAPEPAGDRLQRDRCPVCGSPVSNTGRPIRDHHSLESFSLVRCRACGAGFVADPPRPDRLSSYYDNDAGTEMHSEPGRLFARLRRISIERDLGWLLRRLPPRAGVVDFGTGDGSVARFLHSRGYRAGAVDLYEPSAWHDPDIPYQQYSMSGEPLDAALFTVDGQPAQAVILRHVLEHLIEPRDVLDLATRARVRFVFAIVPNAESRMSRVFGDNWYYWDPPRHLTSFTPGSLRRLAAAAGFSVAELTTSGVDEVVTSLHRAVLLSGRASDRGWRRTAARMTRPTGLVAGLSSASVAFVAGSVCRVLFDSEGGGAQADGVTPTEAYTAP